jgi:hypothetical protein
MLIIHGPTYRYQGEHLAEPTVILVQDHHYNENDQCFHLQKLLAGSQQHTVIFDHVVQHNEFLDDPVYFPLLLAKETHEFAQQQITVDWSYKNVAFNFMINKARSHRLWLLNTIDQLGLTNFCHSLCWQQSPCKSIPVTDYRMGEEFVMSQGLKNGHYFNALTYAKLLQKSVFEPSCVSVITEPVWHERETIVTEKTIMSIYGGTIPIWFGGWRIPDYMRSLGFDVFDDLVDHSYQSLDDPYRRCQQSILRNMNLLKNPCTVDQQRLQYNLDLLKTNPWLTQVNSLIKTYPDLRRVWPASLHDCQT